MRPDAWRSARPIAAEPLDTIDLDDLEVFIRVTGELGESLDRQRVVRLAGQHDPRDVRLAGEARGIRILGRELR